MISIRHPLRQAALPVFRMLPRGLPERVGYTSTKIEAAPREVKVSLQSSSNGGTNEPFDTSPAMQMPTAIVRAFERGIIVITHNQVNEQRRHGHEFKDAQMA